MRDEKRLPSPQQIVAAYERGILTKRDAAWRLLHALKGVQIDSVLADLPEHLTLCVGRMARKFKQHPNPESPVYLPAAPEVVDEVLRYLGPRVQDE